MMNDANLTKILIDNYGVKKEIIALRTKASVRSVERWYDGDALPLPTYQDVLRKMVERKQRDREALRG